MDDHTLFVAARTPLAALLAGISLGLSTPLAGQVVTVTGDKPQASQPAATALLDPNPFVAESIGLKVHFPAGAAVVAEKVSAQLAISVSDAAEIPAWSMRIQPVSATRAQATAATLVDDLLQDLKARRVDFTPISNAAVVIGGTMGQLAYIRQSGPDGQRIVSGWLVLPSGPQSFLVFAIQCLEGAFDTAKPIFDASFASIEIQSVEEIASQRLTRLEAGRAMLEGVTKEKLKSLVGARQWLRIYKTKPDGKTSEVGCSMMEVLEGKRRDVNEQRSARGKGNDAEGLLVRIQGRIVIDAARREYYDSMALYWMAWDQSEEEWSVVGTHRQGEAAQSEAESGVRERREALTPRPRLIVIKSDRATNARTPSEWHVPEVYLSQPLGWVLARLMPAGISDRREFAFYAYNFSSTEPQLTQRLDVWEPAGDGTGNYRMTTRLSSDTAPIVSIYKPDGSLVRRTHPDGAVTEPISIEELHRLWKSKGLQVSSSGR